ncbi:MULTISPECIES: RraA family protein [unclassified Achromobacter]|uniref:RraA family protein n=1 Tax=unclassified Achromobacter TaxID=2626865 RepID=UPI000B51D288|nr:MULTISPECIES: RraA family protein [unclassified Achromobacter]OWT80410.1 dimethylmenaquinone methyltransferase [Achromobacter sp. HZ34]OWT82293.1 dimethylmenaquinone methyltransferase [Achromobacter sp. HZ28]
MTAKIPTGKIDPSRIRMTEVPHLSNEIIEGFRALGDASSAVSDALDYIGVTGAIAASTLVPVISGATLVGYALTLRNMKRNGNIHQAALDKNAQTAEAEAHNLATKDDVLVIQGVPGISNMGGVGALIAKRNGEVGAIIDGGFRDVADMRNLNFPVWSTERTPLTGKWRIEAVEINGPVVICGIRVYPGDLVVADDTGVCFVPRDRAAEVLEYAQKKTAAEQAKSRKIADGVSFTELSTVKA